MCTFYTLVAHLEPSARVWVCITKREKAESVCGACVDSTCSREDHSGHEQLQQLLEGMARHAFLHVGGRSRRKLLSAPPCTSHMHDFSPAHQKEFPILRVIVSPESGRQHRHMMHESCCTHRDLISNGVRQRLRRGAENWRIGAEKQRVGTRSPLEGR